MMPSFTKIKHNNKSKWLLVNADKACLIDGSPLDSDYKVLSIEEISEKNILKYVPFDSPSKVIGLGRNYKDLVGDLDTYEEPVMFLKSPTSITCHLASIKLPRYLNKVWVEVELVIVIGKEGKNISTDRAEEHIFGYSIGSDITAANIHNRDWHLARSKSLDNFAPTGPYIRTDVDTSNLKMVSYINDEIVQLSNTNKMILNVSEIISMISRYMTLKTGDLIFTGTPGGATEALIKNGDVVRHEIESLGELKFFVR